MSVQVPVILEADVLVIGGTLQGCQLARRLRDAARRVVLVCEGDSLGVDGPGQLLPTEENGIEGDARALEDTLLSSGAQILYDAFPLRPLREANGPRQIAGWIFFGAGGYFAIAAKAVVDATPTGHLPFQARLSRRSTGTRHCVLQWNLLGSAKEPPAASGIRLEVSLTPETTPEGPLPLCRATRELRLRPTDLPARLDAESALRAALWSPHAHKGAEWCDWQSAEDPWTDFTTSREIPLFRHSTAQVPTLLRYTLPQVTAPATFQNAEARRELPESESLVFQGKSPRPHTGLPTIRLDLQTLNPQEAAFTPQALILGAGETGCAAALQAQKEGLSYLLAEASGTTALPPDSLAPDEIHHLWHHCRLGGVLLKNGVLTGALILAATGEACLVRAEAFLDATGTAQFAWALGAPMLHPHEPEIISQHCALAPRLHYASQQPLRPARQRVLDPQDHACQILRRRRDPEAKNAFQLPPRIRGDLTLMPQDLLLKTHRDDALALFPATLPTAAKASHPLLWLQNDTIPRDTVIPLPAGVFLSPRHQNLLTLGDALSAHTDLRAMLATPQSHQIQGRLAARLAAYALAHHISLRDVPADAIREKEATGAAAETPALSPQAEALSRAFLRPDQARRSVQADFESHPDTQTALLLAFLGDSSGRRLLAQEFATGTPDPTRARLLLQALAIIGTPATPLLSGLPAAKDLPTLLPGLLACLAHWPGTEAVPLLERLLADLPATQPHNPEGPHTDDHCREILVARVLAACAPNHEEALRVLEAARDEWPLALALPALSFLSHKPATHAKP